MSSTAPGLVEQGGETTAGMLTPFTAPAGWVIVDACLTRDDHGAPLEHIYRVPGQELSDLPPLQGLHTHLPVGPRHTVRPLGTGCGLPDRHHGVPHRGRRRRVGRRTVRAGRRGHGAGHRSRNGTSSRRCCGRPPQIRSRRSVPRATCEWMPCSAAARFPSDAKKRPCPAGMNCGYSATRPQQRWTVALGERTERGTVRSWCGRYSAMISRSVVVRHSGR